MTERFLDFYTGCRWLAPDGCQIIGTNGFCNDGRPSSFSEDFSSFDESLYFFNGSYSIHPVLVLLNLNHPSSGVYRGVSPFVPVFTDENGVSRPPTQFTTKTTFGVQFRGGTTAGGRARFSTHAIGSPNFGDVIADHRNGQGDDDFRILLGSSPTVIYQEPTVPVSIARTVLVVVEVEQNVLNSPSVVSYSIDLTINGVPEYSNTFNQLEAQSIGLDGFPLCGATSRLDYQLLGGSSGSYRFDNWHLQQELLSYVEP